MDYLHLIIFILVNSVFYAFLFTIHRYDKKQLEEEFAALSEEDNQEIERLREEIIEIKSNAKKVESYEVKDLLNDLMAGEALVKVSRVSPDNIFIRSVKEQKGN